MQKDQHKQRNNHFKTHRRDSKKCLGGMEKRNGQGKLVFCKSQRVGDKVKTWVRLTSVRNIKIYQNLLYHLKKVYKKSCFGIKEKNERNRHILKPKQIFLLHPLE